MIPIKRIKELTDDLDMSDEEATILRDEMHEFVTILYEKWKLDKQKEREGKGQEDNRMIEEK